MRYIMGFLFILSFSISSYSQDTDRKKVIYQFDIKEEIAPPVWHYTKKAFREARDMDADIILIHMNTYGGLVESADSIRTAILSSSIPVWVFIDNNAASAGALISIACDSIYMRPGGSIGAATVVDQTGKPLPDKYQSYMRSQMRSTAEQTGRDPDIAQAMVDPSVYIPGVIDSTHVLTFTPSEAMKHGYCNNTGNSITEVISKAGIKDYDLVKQRLTFSDKVIGFLTKPAISGLLILMIIGGIYFELQTPGIGFPLVIALIGVVLYFAPFYIEGLANHWEILLFIIGVVLLLVEIFAIPGFGVAGVTGLLLIVLSLGFAMVGNDGLKFEGVPVNDVISAFTLVISMVFLGIIGSIYLADRIFKGQNRIADFALKTTQPSGEGYVSSGTEYRGFVGHKAQTHTMLRPAGKVMIDGVIYDAVAETGFIDRGEDVVVVAFENAQLIVRRA